MRLWTTAGFVAQPTHTINTHGEVTRSVEPPERREVMLQRWLPTIASLIDFALDHLRVDELWLEDARQPSAMPRMQEQARSELANELRSQIFDAEAATTVLSAPIESQLAVTKHNRPRVYLTTHQGSWYIAQVILNVSEA
ncbi:MAG: hypothetical protein ABW321_31835 [Polyangiales bacterium]